MSTPTVQLVLNQTATAVETYPDASAADATLAYQGYDLNLALDANSTPPVSAKSKGALAMTSGAGILDLLILANSSGGTFSGTGKKVRYAEFTNPSTNSGPITLTFGAATPYNLLGAAFLFAIAVGETIKMYLADNAPTIGSGAKHIDISGTGTDVLDYFLVLG